MFVRDVCAWCLWVMWLCFYSPSPLFVFQLCYQDMLVKQGLASVGHPVEPRSRCHREIRLVLTTFLAPTPTPAICVRETNLVPEPRRTICLMFDSRREWQADSCLISSEIMLLEPQICRQYCRQLSVFSNLASQSQPGRSDDRNFAPKMAGREKYESAFSCVAGYR